MTAGLVGGQAVDAARVGGDGVVVELDDDLHRRGVGATEQRRIGLGKLLVSALVPRAARSAISDVPVRFVGRAAPGPWTAVSALHRASCTSSAPGTAASASVYATVGAAVQIPA